MCNDTGRSPRCEASGNRFLPANISGAIWRFMHGLDSRTNKPDRRQHLTACTEPFVKCLHHRGRP